MERLASLALDIRSFAAGGNPVLGICLGQQLLFDSSEELGEHRGLGLLPGRVKYLPGGAGLKIPHIGWSGIFPTNCAEGVELPLIRTVQAGEQVYFVHSLYTECAQPTHIAATAHYGIDFPAMVCRDNIWGAQFHPEKSGDVGLRILKSFVEW
jgi:imidazole glycerol-phosphate synthase subunit HisH